MLSNNHLVEMVANNKSCRIQPSYLTYWGEPLAYFALQPLYNAYQRCIKRKQYMLQACLYRLQWLDELVATRNALQPQQWQPKPPVVFVVTQPKAREVHAAQFCDRVVHHLLVAELEALLDKQFIYDAASNRKGKGTHFAVNRLHGFMRKMPQGYFLQLDIANFFNAVVHQTLISLLAGLLQKQLDKGMISLSKRQHLLTLCQTIIGQNIQNSIPVGQANELAKVPKHKRLSEQPQGVGLPIGNLTSQFFANVYLNPLDQFIKHQLKCRFYVRYVDDFVICHNNSSQLKQWHEQITEFLQCKLSLTLRPSFVLKAIENGADFLGYIVRPNYTLVRKRVLGNLHHRLQVLKHAVLNTTNQGELWQFNPEFLKQCQAILASYFGHFKHANSHRLRQALFKRYAWLTLLFIPQPNCSLVPRWQPPKASRFYMQWLWFAQQYPNAVLLIQCGNSFIFSRVISNLIRLAVKFTVKPFNHPNLSACCQLPMAYLTQVTELMRANAYDYVVVAEQGYLNNGLKWRVLSECFVAHQSLSPTLTSPQTQHQTELIQRQPANLNQMQANLQQEGKSIPSSDQYLIHHPPWAGLYQADTKLVHKQDDKNDKAINNE